MYKFTAIKMYNWVWTWTNRRVFMSLSHSNRQINSILLILRAVTSSEINQIDKMLLNHICSRFKALILGCLTVFNRTLCCFSRKRRNSFSDCEVLQSVSVVNNEYSSKKRSEVSIARICNRNVLVYQVDYFYLEWSRLEFLGWFATYCGWAYRTVPSKIGAGATKRKSGAGYRFLSGT